MKITLTELRQLVKNIIKEEVTKKKGDTEYEKEVDRYKYFIVDLEKKEGVSGWEYKPDAIDALSDYDEDPNFKIFTLKQLEKMKIKDPRPKFKNA